MSAKLKLLADLADDKELNDFKKSVIFAVKCVEKIKKRVVCV
jgi:hypothetical protein